MGAESGRRIAEKSKELYLRIIFAEIGIRFDVMPGNSAKISVEATDSIQIGSLDKGPMVVPIFSAFN